MESIFAIGWNAKTALPTLVQWTGAASINVNGEPLSAETRWMKITCCPSNTARCAWWPVTRLSASTKGSAARWRSMLASIVLPSSNSFSPRR